MSEPTEHLEATEPLVAHGLAGAGAGAGGGAGADSGPESEPANVAALASLAASLAVLAARWDTALVGAPPVASSPHPFSALSGDYLPSAVMLDVERMSDTGLIETTRAVFQIIAHAQALLIRTAGEISTRSRRILGADALARKHGHPTAGALIAELGLIPIAEAQRYCRVGESTALQRSLLGGRAEPRYPILATAVDDGEVGIASAAVILSNLDQASPRSLWTDMVAAETELTTFAKEHLADIVRKLAIHWRDALDTDGIAPREEELIARRSLVWKKLVNGMERCTITLDPLGAGYLHAVISARVGDQLRAVHFTDDPAPLPPCPIHANRNSLIDCGCPRIPANADADADAEADVATETAADAATDSATATGAGVDGVPEPATVPDTAPDTESGCGLGNLEDLRSIPQLSYDALIDVLQHALGCTTAPGTLPHTTLVVRMDLDALISGIGAARIEGIEQPITARTARNLAADAHIIPQVFGGDSAVLDQGTGKRLFTRAQRLALLEREDGCAMRDCQRPASHTEAHHIDWWARDNGPTDLANGILLCTAHHHAIHSQHWDIRVIDNVPWFIPPAHIDPTRTPRRGGRLPTPKVPSLTTLQHTLST